MWQFGGEAVSAYFAADELLLQSPVAGGVVAPLLASGGVALVEAPAAAPVLVAPVSALEEEDAPELMAPGVMVSDEVTIELTIYGRRS